ncbi:MAG: Rne/Rng family ribonuclease [Flavobacteriales bacterium]|nr:Rne/Rng family ribonuclease [Flavobacteriales bacterium]
MANELIIDFSSAGERIALLRDKKLVELHIEQSGSGFSVGDLYLGVVKKFKQELNAAFVDVGYHKDAFLHYHDLGPNIHSLNKLTRIALQGGMKSGDLSDFKLEPETQKTGQINNTLKKGQKVLVQVVKEPISSKGPRLSMEVSIAGKYFIMVPFISTVSVSKKIEEKEERQRLKNLALSLKGPNFGLICRTAAQGQTVQDLHKDLIELQERWDKAVANLHNAKPGQVILSDGNRSHMVLRDLLSEKFTSIVTNDKSSYDELKNYLAKLSPEMQKSLKLHKSKESIFSHYGIDKQIKMLFGKTVNIQGGVYLVIEHTEALHVIDVNSGSRQRSGEAQDDYALGVNIEAAKEIARQLRLRDMGGIIVIDFIDLRNPAHKRQLTEVLKNEMASDRAKHTILPMSKFGLVQITRQRVRPEMNIATSEECPMCHGNGVIEASILLDEEIEQTVEQLLKFGGHKHIELCVHPYLHAFYTKGIPSKQQKWFLKHKKWVKVTEDKNYHYGEYRFFDANEEEIVI